MRGSAEFCNQECFSTWTQQDITTITATASKIIMEKEAWKCAAGNFFYIISIKCASSSTFSPKNHTIKQKNILETCPSLPLSKITRLGQRSVCSSAGVLSKWFGLRCLSKRAQSCISYFSRCTQNGAQDPAFVFPCKASWLLHDGEWRTLRACEAPPLPWEKEWIAGYTAARACLASPGTTSRGV